MEIMLGKFVSDCLPAYICVRSGKLCKALLGQFTREIRKTEAEKKGKKPALFLGGVRRQREQELSP